MKHKFLGTLYIVATPIGNLNDISFRAVETLKEVDSVLAEDTRHSRTLLNYYGIDKPLISIHEHNERAAATRCLETLLSGKSLALISDAGTPLISDPGYHLVNICLDAKIKVVPIPGPSALLCALQVSGLPTDRFIFEGFLPSKPNARGKRLLLLKEEERTMIFFEAPHRLLKTLTSMIEVFGSERVGVLARELTKTFETIKRLPLTELFEWVKADENQQKGESVLVIAGKAL